MHRTRIEPETITVIEDTERRQAIAFRWRCSCGHVSAPLLSQGDAGRGAREHREAFDDGPRLRLADV